MSTNLIEDNIKYHLHKFEPFVKQMIKRYSKVRYYAEEEIISWANQGIVEALDNIPEDCKNVNSYIMSYITNYVKLGLRDNGHFINLKSKWADRSPEIRKINNIVSLDDQIKDNDASSSNYIEMMPSAILPPDQQVEDKETAEVMSDAIDSLSGDYATIVRQYIYEGKTFEQIAQGLGFSKQLIEQRYQKALKMLKFSLQNKI